MSAKTKKQLEQEVRALQGKVDLLEGINHGLREAMSAARADLDRQTNSLRARLDEVRLERDAAREAIDTIRRTTEALARQAARETRHMMRDEYGRGGVLYTPGPWRIPEIPIRRVPDAPFFPNSLGVPFSPNSIA